MALKNIRFSQQRNWNEGSVVEKNPLQVKQEANLKEWKRRLKDGEIKWTENIEKANKEIAILEATLDGKKSISSVTQAQVKQEKKSVKKSVSKNSSKLNIAQIKLEAAQKDKTNPQREALIIQYVKEIRALGGTINGGKKNTPKKIVKTVIKKRKIQHNKIELKKQPTVELKKLPVDNFNELAQSALNILNQGDKWERLVTQEELNTWVAYMNEYDYKSLQDTRDRQEAERIANIPINEFSTEDDSFQEKIVSHKSQSDYDREQMIKDGTKAEKKRIADNKQRELDRIAQQKIVEAANRKLFSKKRDTKITLNQ